MFAVKVDNLSKVYRFYQKPVHRLWEAIIRKPMHSSFKALEGVSFSVPFGATLGIIGENGAGKSTILKILAKTLSPSEGHICINGKVAAILELGAGFHQEFTGRQNIYLNASLLGMPDRDIRQKEDEIIEFSELKMFIDRPLKSYSSGMVVRLAFSIAACVDPDILIVDEALSVGDVRFQQKCIQKMIRFRESGKTLIFCSHSMYQISELCSETIWLNRGKIKRHACTGTVVSEFMSYLDIKNNGQGDNGVEVAEITPQSEAYIKKVRVLDSGQNTIVRVSELDDLIVRIETSSNNDGFCGHIGAAIFDLQDQMVFGTSTKHSGHPFVKLAGKQLFEVCLKSVPIKRGTFKIKAFILDKECLRVIDEYSTKPYQFFSERPDLGYLRIENNWTKIG